MLRVLEDRVAAAVFHHITEIHHHHLVSDVTNDAEIMADENIGQTKLVLEILEQVENLGLNRQVECRDGLIQHQKARIEHQRPGDGNALALPAREHVRIAIEVLWPQTNLDQHGHRLVPTIGSRHFGVEHERLGQHVADFLARIERPIGVLKNDLHLLAHLVGDVAGINGFTIDQDFARGRWIDQCDHAGQCGLATTAFTDHGQRLALFEREVHALDGMNDLGGPQEATGADIVALEIADFENGGSHQFTPGAGSKTKSDTVGKRSPTAFSGSAESSARV